MFRLKRLGATALVLAVLTACADGGPTRQASPVSSPPAPSATVVAASPVSAGASVGVADRTLRRIELTGGPDFLAASGGLLWVKLERPVLLGLDPATGDVRRRLQVAENPAGVNGICLGLGGDERHLWTCAGTGVGLVAPGATQVDAVPGLKKIADQATLPVVAGRVWVVEPDGAHVTGLLVADGSDPVRLPLGARCVDAAAGKGSYLWLACPTDGMGLRLDVQSGDVVQVPGLRDARTVAVGDEAFFAYRMGLARVDQDSAQVTGAVAVAGAASLHVVDGVVWARGGGDVFLRKVDARSLALLEEITAPEQGGGQVLAAYGAVWASAYDENALYRLRPA